MGFQGGSLFWGGMYDFMKWEEDRFILYLGKRANDLDILNDQIGGGAMKVTASIKWDFAIS